MNQEYYSLHSSHKRPERYINESNESIIDQYQSSDYQCMPVESKHLDKYELIIFESLQECRKKILKEYSEVDSDYNIAYKIFKDQTSCE